MCFFMLLNPISTQVAQLTRLINELLEKCKEEKS